MTIELGIGIQTVPARAGMLAALHETLHQQETTYATGVQCDTKQEGPTKTWLDLIRNMLMPARFTHILLLEDDAIPCLDFIAAAKEAIAARPDSPISFCAVLPYESQPVGHWVAYGKRHRTNVAIAFPKPWLQRFYDWASRPETAQEIGPFYVASDAVLSYYLVNVLKQPMWVTVPQLVEHGGSGKSARPGGQGTWLTKDFIGADVSGLGIEW